MKNITGKIHSFQSLGAVDGPGLRFVIFMQGCPFRCIYCHNPDTWSFEGGSIYTSDEIVSKVLRYKTYFKNNGGVTVSGGEPLCQKEFVAELFEKLKKNGIHTALDTTGMIEGCENVLDYTDLVLCDLKFPTDEQYKEHCGGSLSKVTSFMKICESKNIPVWIRHVVVPGITDSKENIRNICMITNRFTNIKKIELLPFHNMCIEKYDRLNIDFPLREALVCSKEKIKELYKIIDDSLCNR